MTTAAMAILWIDAAIVLWCFAQSVGWDGSPLFGIVLLNSLTWLPIAIMITYTQRFVVVSVPFSLLMTWLALRWYGRNKWRTAATSERRKADRLERLPPPPGQSPS